MNFDLTAFAVVACPDPSSETCEDCVANDWVNVLEEGVNEEGGCVAAPMAPVSLPGFGSRRHA